MLVVVSVTGGLLRVQRLAAVAEAACNILPAWRTHHSPPAWGQAMRVSIKICNIIDQGQAFGTHTDVDLWTLLMGTRKRVINWL